MTALSVSEAVAQRRSVRGFLPDPVENAVLRDVFTRASRAPSGGNLQPWRLYVLDDRPHGRGTNWRAAGISGLS